MKNLRQQNPALKALLKKLTSSLERWGKLSFAEQTEVCLQFLALPILQKESEISAAIRQALAPSATELAAHANQLLAEIPDQFKSIGDLLDKTTSLYMDPEFMDSEEE
jgi:hypothetical protein